MEIKRSENVKREVNNWETPKGKEGILDVTIDTVDSIWNLIFDTVLAAWNIRSSQPHFFLSKIYYLYFIAYNAQEILGFQCVICVSNMGSALQLLRDEEIATSIVLYMVTRLLEVHPWV